MKRIVVVVAATGKAHDLDIQPGTTARDVLNNLELRNYVLSKDGAQNTFAAGENIYAAVEDGAKVFATTLTDVGIAN